MYNYVQKLDGTAVEEGAGSRVRTTPDFWFGFPAKDNQVVHPYGVGE